MQRLLLRRLASIIVVLAVVATVSFMLIAIAPGDPAATILGDQATQEDIAALRAQMGLDKPLPVQLGLWFWQLLQGNLGHSIYYGEPVIDLILQRLEASTMLALFATVLAFLCGVPMGLFAATRRGGLLDKLIMGVAVFGMSVPGFWLALILVLLFSLQLRWTPISGYPGLSEDPVGSIHALILPAISVAAAQSAWVARVARSAMLETLNLDYIRTARAKGLHESTVILRHAFRNAVLPIVTVLGIVIMTAFSSAVVIEEVFALPGVGRLVIRSVLRRDYPTILGVVMFIAVVWTFINLLVDMLYVYLDPRIKYE